jgi:hypothetical protein
LTGIAFGAPSAAAQATLAELHSPAALAAKIHELRGCVRSLPASDRFLLALRFGIGGRPQKTDAAVAARLHTTSAIVAAREITAVRRLAAAQRRGACKRTPVRTSAASSAPALALSPVGAAGGSNRSGGGGISSGDLLAGAVILAALIVVAREFHKALFAPPPRR